VERRRSRRRGDKEKKEKDRGDRGGDEAPPARQTSEERRAMIASWNADREAGDVVA